MYYIIVPLLTVGLPVGSVVTELLLAPSADVVFLIGKWFTFWGIGVRVLLAGVTQIFKPDVTARSILGLESSDYNIVIQELGFANVALGILGIASLAVPSWLVPAALAGGLFLGLAGVRHIMKPERNARENIAMVTDLVVFSAAMLFLLAQMKA